jgi:hypothetical protein
VASFVVTSPFSFVGALKRATRRQRLRNNNYKTLIVSKRLTRNVSAELPSLQQESSLFSGIAQHFVMTIRLVSYI